MKSRPIFFFLLGTLCLSVNALANNGKTYIVTDENPSFQDMDSSSSEVTDTSIATPSYTHGETLDQFIANGVFTLNGVVDPDADAKGQHTNIVVSDTFAAFLITDKDRDDIFSEHNIIGFYSTNGQLLLLQNNNNNQNGGGTNGGTPPGGGGTPPGDGGNTSVVPEPSAWALVFGSLAVLVIFRRFRFARR